MTCAPQAEPLRIVDWLSVLLILQGTGCENQGLGQGYQSSGVQWRMDLPSGHTVLLANETQCLSRHNGSIMNFDQSRDGEKLEPV